MPSWSRTDRIHFEVWYAYGHMTSKWKSTLVGSGGPPALMWPSCCGFTGAGESDPLGRSELHDLADVAGALHPGEARVHRRPT
jgi:hypothetical protein